MSNLVDLREMISDWYICPICGKTLVGLMSWASHTAQIHNMSCHEFSKIYGEIRYYGGITLQYDSTIWNPSRRELKVDRKNAE